MTESLIAVQARIAELQSLLSARRPAAALGGASTSSSSQAFTAALTEALAGTGATVGSSTGFGTTAVDLGAAAVAKARQYTGVPYRWGGEDPATGMDCSGLVQYVYGSLGIDLPRVAADQSQAGERVASLDQARPGDLVFFGSPATHVGIYVGDGKMIDAPRAGKTVGVHPLWGAPSAIRRVTPEIIGATAGTAGARPSGPYAAEFAAAGARHGVDPTLLSAVARAESGYNPRAVSPAGAQGLMQLMPGTARSLGVNAYDPTQAVDGAARLLADLLSDFGGNVDLALAGYNAGPGAVRKHGGVPPYTETQNYVRRVNQYWKDSS
jgi:cell wall-associated NlpC family hydrolase